MSIGVPYNTFFRLNIRTLQPFIDAEKIAFKKKNEELWINGLYTHNAVATAVNQNLGGKAKYLEKPIDFENANEEEREFTEEEKLELQKKVLLQLQVMELNYKHGNKENKEER